MHPKESVWPKRSRRLVANARAMDFLDDGGALRSPAYFGRLRQQRAAGFTLTLASGQTGAATITQGGTVNIGFEVAPVHGSTGSITLVLNGLPPKVGVAPGAATVGIGSPQTFVLSAASNASVTSAPVTLTATGISGNAQSSDSITHSQTLTLAVAAPAAP